MTHDVDDLGIKDVATQQKLSGFKVSAHLGRSEDLGSSVIEEFDFVVLEVRDRVPSDEGPLPSSSLDEQPCDQWCGLQ